MNTIKTHAPRFEMSSENSVIYSRCIECERVYEGANASAQHQTDMKIQDIYTEAVRRLGGDASPLHWGPAHVVWEDSNFDFVDECLKNFDQHKGDYTQPQLAIVRWSLEELSKLNLENS